MKLVELLAKELDVWPRDAKNITQDSDRAVSPCTKYDDLEFNGSRWCCSGGFDNVDIIAGAELSEDYRSAIVTREMWQAERDRQKGGEWKRHRGGWMPTGLAGMVEVKLRCGDIQRADSHALLWRHEDCDVAVNIMQYRVISQPQAEEVEVNKFCAGEKCSAAAEHIVHSQQCQLEHEMAYTGFKIDQIDGPIKWRDTVNELDAYIEEFTREREALINRLALEGFALLPAMTSVMGVADVDMPIDQWQIGDIIEVVARKGANSHEFEIGEHVRIDGFDLDDDNLPVKCYALDESDFWYLKYEEAKFIRRP